MCLLVLIVAMDFVFPEVAIELFKIICLNCSLRRVKIARLVGPA